MAGIKQINRKVKSLIDEVVYSDEPIGLRADLINRLCEVRDVCENEIQHRETEIKKIGFQSNG